MRGAVKVCGAIGSKRRVEKRSRQWWCSVCGVRWEVYRHVIFMVRGSPRPAGSGLVVRIFARLFYNDSTTIWSRKILKGVIDTGGSKGRKLGHRGLGIWWGR